MIDWQAFTPISAFTGGMIIGLAVTLLLLVAGRIAGISGIVGGLIELRKGDLAWRVAFITGLLLAPWLWRWLGELPRFMLKPAMRFWCWPDWQSGSERATALVVRVVTASAVYHAFHRVH